MWRLMRTAAAKVTFAGIAACLLKQRLVRNPVVLITAIICKAVQQMCQSYTEQKRLQLHGIFPVTLCYVVSAEVTIDSTHVEGSVASSQSSLF